LFAASSARLTCWRTAVSICRPSTLGCGSSSRTAHRPGSIGRPSWTPGRQLPPAHSWSGSGCAPCAVGATPSSAEKACSTPRYSSASPASSRSCGWLMTNAASTGVSTTGMARSAPSTTPAASGGCSRWTACRSLSTTWCCPECDATSCSRHHAWRRPRHPAMVPHGGGRWRPREPGRRHPGGRCWPDRPGLGVDGPRPRRASGSSSGAPRRSVRPAR
jgi:hypothetical protein